MNLSDLTFADLKSLSVKVQTEIEKRQHVEVKEARDQILAIAEKIGVSLTDLLNMKTIREEKTSKPVEVKFRHPENAGKTWTGRGRKPSWIVDLEQSGRIDSARI